MDYFSGLVPEPADRKKRGLGGAEANTSIFGSGILPDSYYAPSAPAPTRPTSSPGFTSDIARASGQFVSGVGSTLRDLGAEDIGGAVEQYGTGVVQRNPSEIRSFGDVLSRPFTTTREAVGEVIPQVGLALGGRAAGALAGGLIAGPPGALVGGFLGGLAPVAAQTYGGIRSEQREKGIDERGRALAVTIPAALLERFGGPERLALKVAGEGTEFLRRLVGTGFTKNAAKQFARGGIEELVTELPQTALERYGVSGQTADLTSPEALSEYGVAGAKSFLGGGAIRAGLSSLAGTRQEPTVTIQPDGTITSDQPLTGIDGETDLTGGSNVLMTPAQAEQRLTQIQNRRPQALADSEFEPIVQRGLFDTRGGMAPPAPVQGEQIDLFGGGGVAPTPFVDEQQGDLFAPAEPSFQTRITAELLDGLGLPRQSPMYRQLLGKDMADPAQQPQIAELFDRVRTDDKISERTKAGVEGLAMQAFGGLAQQQEMIGPRGGAYPQGKPSTQRDAPGPVENLLPTAPMGVIEPAATEPAPVAAPVVAEAPAAPAPIAAPSIPIGVDLTPEENRAVRQAKAVFDIAETDSDRRNVAAIIQRIVDRASQRSGIPAAQPVTPVGASNAVAAALPAATGAAGVSSTPATTGAPLGTQAPKTVETKTQRAQAPAASVSAEVTAEEDKALLKLIEDADKADVGNPLPASVRGSESVRAPGRSSISTEMLKKIRDALLRPSGKVGVGAGENEQRIVNALNNFTEAYKKYSDQGGQVLSRRNKIPKSKTAGQFAEEQVSGAEAQAANVQAALAELGEAVGGNAKNIEAVVRLVKDMVQGKIVAPGKTRAEVIQAGKKLDTMLSQAWAAAKRETFMNARVDLADVRGGSVRVAREQAGEISPLERAATEGVANPKGQGETFTGLKGVLQYIRNSGTPFERMLSGVLRDVVNDQMSTVKLKFISEGNARFDPKTNTVYLRKNESPEVVLHEALHAALQSFIYNNPKDPMVMQLKRSLKAVVDYKGQLTGKAKEVQDLLKKLVADKNELDAVLELVSYGTTLNEFRKALEAMPSKGVPQSFRDSVNSVWRYIKAAMARMLDRPNTVASDVLDSSLALLEKASKVKPEKNVGNILEDAVDTATSAFKRWFGDSKVVDSNGNPIVVYHGTTADFSEFSKAELGKSTMVASAKKGFFFGGSSEIAERFAQISNRSKSLTADQSYANFLAYVEDKKQKLLAAEKTNNETETKAAKEELAGAEEAFVTFSEMRQNIMPVYLSLQNPLVVDQKGKSFRDEPYASIIDRAIKGGHDGVIIKNTYDGKRAPSLFDKAIAKISGKSIPTDTIYIAFEPNQIKSVFNRGTYDPNSNNILEAAVQSNDTVAQEAGWADAAAFAKGPGGFKTPTQVAFELIGLGRVNGKDLPITSMIKESGVKVAEYIRKNVPTLERMILNFNSKFSNGSLVNDLIERFKYMQNTGYLQMERIAQHLANHPELAKPFLDFMDGNSKALDGIKNGSAFKAIAENLQTLMTQYIESLPANSPERRVFQNVKFSQYLLHPDSIGQVAGSTFGVQKLSSMLGIERRGETSLDEFKDWLKEDADGRVDINDPLYQVFEDKGGQTIPFGFISAEKFKDGLVPAGVKVDESRVWKMSQYKEGAYQFTSSKATTSDARRQLTTEELSAALLNTTAALAHTFASRNFLGGIANIGREDGKATSGTIAFNDVNELNATYPDAKTSNEKLLEVSDESSKSPQIRWRAQRTGVWVKLPTSGTYGPLAGKIVPGPVWNSMLDMHDRAPLVNIQAFNDVMAFFKKSKTVYNPGTHVTNILSNVTLSILHGITPTAMGRAAKLYLDFEMNPDNMSKENLALMKAFYASGAVLGQFSSSEVKKTVYDKLNQAITPDSDSSYITKLKTFSSYERAKAQLAKYDNKASEIYAAEDNVFRLAAFLNTAGNIQLRDGSKSLDAKQLEEAGLAGRKMFLDYDIDARAIRAMRQSFMPFISWSYAIMPVLGRIAIEKPWAMANVLMTYALMQAALGGEEEEEKRKMAPDYLRDRAWGGLGPYMHMRLPFLGDDENPVYFNLGKYIPMFTLFQPPPGESKLAGQDWVPGFATPSGPLTTLLSAMNGYDPFTGKPMHDPTDTQWDKLVNTGKAVYNTMAPAAVNANFWKNIGDLAEGATGPTGVEKSALFLARNLGGLGLYQFNVDESAFYQRKEVKNLKREFNTAIAKAKRAEYSKGYPDYEALDAELDDLRTRLQEEIAKARGEE